MSMATFFNFNAFVQRMSERYNRYCPNANGAIKFLTRLVGVGWVVVVVC